MACLIIAKKKSQYIFMTAQHPVIISDLYVELQLNTMIPLLQITFAAVNFYKSK